MKKVIHSNKIRKSILFLILIFLSFESFSQQKSVEKDKIYFLSAEQTRGTFQFEVTDEEFCNVAVTAELMEEIEKNRHVTDFVYLTLNENCRLKIFPASLIAELRKNPIEPCLITKD